jgi:hypothetical protein
VSVIVFALCRTVIPLPVARALPQIKHQTGITSTASPISLLHVCGPEQKLDVAS